jgi:hypothetical protein
MAKKSTILIVGASRGSGPAPPSGFEAAIGTSSAPFAASPVPLIAFIADEASVRVMHERLNGRTHRQFD